MAMGAKAKVQLAKQKVYLPDIIISDKVTTFAQYVGYQISKHNIPQIWLETEGEGITVAVIDTGCQMDHPDLASNLIDGGSFAQGFPSIDDVAGHGTHVSGIVAAKNDTEGIVGVAPKVKVVVIKVLGDDGSGWLLDVVAGIYAAIEQKVDIISMSLGAPEGDPVFLQAIQKAYHANIPTICAAGNSGDIGRLDYPGRYAETISIGALNENNIRAEWSQTGGRLDFMAPGVEIFSTYPTSTYRSLSGTSMSCPWAAGVVALMMAKHRKIGGKTPLNTVEDVREHLKKTAIDLAQAGKDSTTGYGLVDVEKAIKEIIPEETKEPEGDDMSAILTDLAARFNTWVEGYNVKTTERDQLQTQINELQTQLDAKNIEITAYETKATQINELLS